MRIALVSRELFPLRRGGIGLATSALAGLLVRVAEVTVLTTAGLDRVYEQDYRRRRTSGDRQLPPPEVRVVFVPEPTPEEASAWYHVTHAYSARLLEALRESYPDGGPDLVEFPDFLGEGFVTVQAARSRDPFLAGTRVCVRTHTTAELCEILNGFVKPDLASRAVHELERAALLGADRVIWQGGDILGSYARYYGGSALAPTVRIRQPIPNAVDHKGVASADTSSPDLADAEFSVTGRPLRLLYAGRLERRKGVEDLVRAVTGMERDDFSLSLIGGDTDTGPLGTSVRKNLELALADDHRVRVLEEFERAGLAEEIRSHDVLVMPSLWECWPYAALEALQQNRPVLGTPVGGLVEMLVPGRSGWLAGGRGPAALAQAIEVLLAKRGEVEQLVRSGEPAAWARELCDEREILEGYEALARASLSRSARSACSALRTASSAAEVEPLVSAVIPYHRAARYVRDAVESLLAQTYPRLEIVLVNDGSFEREDWILGELVRRGVIVVTQINRGLGAARNFGISQTRGRYVFPLDADNLAEPDFVARAVEVLESSPEVAYVTSWSRYVEEDGTARSGPAQGYQPLGNRSRLVVEENVAGDAAAVIRRRLFDAGFAYSEDLTSYEDWAFYRTLGQAGHYGAVIPERLLRYRVRADSMQAEVAQPNRPRLMGEIEAHIQLASVQWTQSSA